jgi:hypothetical protein
MPLTTQTSVLARGFDILFDPKLAPVTTPDSARAWAKAYTAYAVSAGIPLAQGREYALAGALTSAFDPNLAGGGPPLFIQALGVFWVGLLIPYIPSNPPMTSTALPLIPSGSVTPPPQPEDATTQQKADTLAATIAAFTLGSVKVLVPAVPASPVTIPIY